MEDNSKMTVTKLKELLYLKICELSEVSEKYKTNETKLALLSDVVKMLDGNMDEVIVNKINLDLLLDNIFIDDDRYNMRLNSILYLYKQYKKMSNQEECENCLNELLDLKNDLINEREKIDTEQIYYKGNINDFEIYKKILSKLKYRQMITKEEFGIIFNFLHEQKLEDKIIVDLCEQIVVFSNDINNKFDKTFDKYAFLNLLKTGFERFPDIHIENKNEIVNRAKLLLQLSKSYNGNIMEFTEQLPFLLDSGMQIEEYKCLYVEIMKQIQNEIKDLIDNACSEEFYMDEEVKKIIMDEYNENVRLYNVVRNHFDTEIDNYNYYLQNNNESNEKEIKTNITFLVSDEDGKSFLERDLKDIRHEKLEDLNDLLIKKRYEFLSRDEFKPLINNKKFRGFNELKTDQIRVIYKRLNYNNIVILGAAEKKDDVDIPMLTRIVSRFKKYYVEALQNTIDHELILESVCEYCEKNKREGTR